MDAEADVSRANDLYITISVMTAAIIVTTSIRIIGKLTSRRALGPQVYLIILGTVLDLVANAFDYKAAVSGFGRHIRFLTPAARIQAVKYAQLAVGVAIWAIWTPQFPVGNVRAHGYVTAATTIVGVALWATQARPLAKLWDHRIEGTILTVGCFTTVFYAISPAYFLWNVQLKWRKKAPVLAIMGCGIIVTVVGLLNIAFARDFLNRADSTWALTNEFICDIIERNISAFVANLPALWQLATKLRSERRAKSSSQRSSGNDTGRSGWFELGRKGYSGRLHSEDEGTHPLLEGSNGAGVVD
ncbi:hypothetical protein BDW59DRAFT_163822 [Aspergillus cavernicola]|uniref:Rhodopsin domain-containing protein n=1 Tax=Aspergillus cavernicola TaxID=176166 RepID=A0ABR4I392_9EURO